MQRNPEKLEIIGYPCVIGTNVGLIRLDSQKELRTWIHSFSSETTAYVKQGFNKKLTPRFILTGNGKFIQFIPKREARGWARFVSSLIDLSKLECEIKTKENLSKNELRELFRSHIKSPDMHFPHTMKAYKILKEGPQDSALCPKQVLKIIQA